MARASALNVRREITVVPKYYIKSNTLELIYSTDKTPLEAAMVALGETNKFDVLDEYFYIDERGMKDYATALPDTIVIPTKLVAAEAGWKM
jgi:metal-dependent hydrolase (beta-lactamase superfamily II)